MLILALGGFLAGTLIAVLMVLIEHSRIAFNLYALFGNGALIVPALLAPFAIYAGWVGGLRRGGRALFFSADTAYGVADAVPGFLFSGSVFVLPAALLAAVALWIGRRVPGPSAAIPIVTGLLGAAFLGIVFGAGLGILSGAAVALERRDPSRAVLIGVLLFVLIVIVGNLPFMNALTSPLPGKRRSRSLRTKNNRSQSLRTSSDVATFFAGELTKKRWSRPPADVAPRPAQVQRAAHHPAPRRLAAGSRPAALPLRAAGSRPAGRRSAARDGSRRSDATAADPASVVVGHRPSRGPAAT